MPIVLNSRLITVTLLLLCYQLDYNAPQYLLIVVQSAYLFFIVIVRPHKLKLDLFRGICVEVGLLYVIVIRVVEINRIQGEYGSEDSIFKVIAYV